jgi:limonene-1,2-epoxide hydrolase
MDAVGGYLDALGRQDWTALRRLLAPGVVRRGPYGDDFHDREAYLAFLAETFAVLTDYELDVHRHITDGDRTCVELAETATLGDRRVRTEEAVIFDVAGGLITGVRVFLQRSRPVA